MGELLFSPEPNPIAPRSEDPSGLLRIPQVHRRIGGSQGIEQSHNEKSSQEKSSSLTSTSLHGHRAVMLRYLLLPLLLQLCQTADPFVVEFDVTLGSKDTGKFQLEVHPDWAPLGAARFKEMVEAEFFKGVRFFRVISGFMAQFGIHPKPTIAAEWKGKALTDDPVVESNKRGYISFATSGKDSRTTQMFINFADNANLDGSKALPLERTPSARLRYLCVTA